MAQGRIGIASAPAKVLSRTVFAPNEVLAKIAFPPAHKVLSRIELPPQGFV